MTASTRGSFLSLIAWILPADARGAGHLAQRQHKKGRARETGPASALHREDVGYSQLRGNHVLCCRRDMVVAAAAVDAVRDCRQRGPIRSLPGRL